MMRKNSNALSPWLFPKWIAHRGGGNVAPENTLKGFETGYQYGFRAVEFDVKLTADNQTIVLHDDDLSRVAEIKKNARDMKYEEITQVDAAINFPNYRPAYVPGFKEIAEFCIQHEIFSNIEIKPCTERDQETATIVAEQTMQYWHGQKLPPFFSSFSIDALRVVQKLYPKSLRGLLLEEWLSSDDEVTALLTELGCISLHANEADLTQKRVQYLIDAGFYVLAWTVNDLVRAEELFKWGVVGIFTDLIDKVTL